MVGDKSVIDKFCIELSRKQGYLDLDGLREA
jgi:hypothetical protein